MGDGAIATSILTKKSQKKENSNNDKTAQIQNRNRFVHQNL